ncbi:MAG: tRNA pseudouridine(38-40) synthase TruA [Xanthomonadales bacterium]|nr:tRNA pseudouridine(38-40) synthase TruA [Xanthomonadales bacterium]
MRIAMGIEYDGTAFLGWQTQAQEPTVQATLEAALAKVADQPVRVHGSGRTDTGVHARQQVLHFDTRAERPMRSWILGTNSNLPEAACILWAKIVPLDFHARFSATGRTYRYRICNRPVRPALGRNELTWIRQALDHRVMHRAGQALVGEHDFSAFRAVSCQARHPVRRLTRLAVERYHDQVDILVEGNAFLHHMVRNIVGSLIEVGQGRQPEGWIQQLLQGRDRNAAGATAPAHGLCLERVSYPKAFELAEPGSGQ